MKKNPSSVSVVLFAFMANLVIAGVKFAVAIVTLSSAILAEAVHSMADTLNQVLLLVGIRKGRREPDNLHPFGFSGELYFWSFIVSIILFSAGAVFSIYKGIYKLMHPEPIARVSYAFFILGISLLAEGLAFYRAFSKVKLEKKSQSIVSYLRNTKKSELIVVFLEDLAALTGLLVALLFISIEQFTGILAFDGLASVVIGIILGIVAFFLARETKSLLLGESADQNVIADISAIFNGDESINHLIYIKSMQLGPDDVLVAVKLEFNERLKSREIANLINGFEKDIRQLHPEVKKIFIEPDIFRKRYA